MITPSTTPTHTFTFPNEIDPNSCTEIQLIYAQEKRTVIEKTKEDFEINGQIVSIKLEQNETRLFNPFQFVEIELWIKLADGTVPSPFRTTETVDTVLGGDI